MSRKKGFTLIELLVVIAIIGILATIVLINLNTARDKAKDAAIKGALSEVRAAAEMEYDDNGDYLGVCDGGSLADDEDFARINTNIEDNGGDVICYSSADKYCAESSLNDDGYWCVDSTGVSQENASETCDSTDFSCD